MNGSPTSLADDAATSAVADSSEVPLRPDYGGACLTEVVPTLLQLEDLRRRGALPAWLPTPLVDAARVVLLVLDGLGAGSLAAHRSVTPVLSSMAGTTITSVAPTTTATALTSLTTGRAPADHGVLGYRVRAGEEVLNVLRWATATGDARAEIRPRAFQQIEPFLGRRVPVVSPAAFAGSGFSQAHLAGSELVGWRVSSSIGVFAARALVRGAPFVYAYYDGIDKVAHLEGLGDCYEAELAAVDRLVADLVDRLPAGCALVVTSDHGQVEVESPSVAIDPGLLAAVTGVSGEGRFCWLHVRPNATDEVAAAARELYGGIAWVRTLAEIDAAGWFGKPLSDAFCRRLGDVALVARAAVAFADPADPGDLRLVTRHGSLTAAEVLVPFLAVRR
ncbi:MAG TPA: alkaline phosphatase family protein [Acidimicrobiales bacterium]|nr:alkaline phosphatase family protein [Acidimicrobiales bacterium]